MMADFSKLAKANLETAEGKQYNAAVAAEAPQKLAWFVEQCSSAAGDEPASFDLLMSVQGDGIVLMTFC